MRVEKILERVDDADGGDLLARGFHGGVVALHELGDELVDALDVRVDGKADGGSGLERVVLHGEVEGGEDEVVGVGGSQARLKETRAGGALEGLPGLLGRARLAELAVELHRLLHGGSLDVVLGRLAVGAPAAHELLGTGRVGVARAGAALGRTGADVRSAARAGADERPDGEGGGDARREGRHRGTGRGAMWNAAHDG